MSYNHQSIEKKWQERWEKAGIFHAKDSGAKKFYCLIEFPYPSGDGIHVGHPRSYTALDVVARKRRHQGHNVLYPIGWDAFGLPTENYAIKNKRKPQDVTLENVATFRRQLQSLGFSFDWSREVNTTDPSYYKWTQWMFLQFFKAGLAYKAKQAINWCLSCKIGLANEEVVNGKCERCGGDTEKRDKEQWMIAITKYAERLLQDLDGVDYLEKIKVQQRNWIGRSEGINIRYDIDGLDDHVEIFTTRPDTNFGATFIALAPDGDFIKRHIHDCPERSAVEVYIKEVAQKSEIDRVAEGRKKTGVFTGLYAINQLTNRRMQIWVADFALGNVGTGVLVGVPGHDRRDFEFATTFGLDIVRVVVGSDGDTSEITREEQVQEESGMMINSGFLNGLDIHEATEKVKDYIESKGWGKRVVNYKLRDWVFSRQRYWGEPIPLVQCQEHGWVAIPDEQLPLVLPDVEKYEPTDTGESPLASIESFVNTTCPTCGAPARRETDTMPNWAGSSWYFLRYIDAHNDSAFAAPDKLKYWMPVDLYDGGNEHTTLHLLYSRFWNKFLFDQGYVPVSEPYVRRHSHGLVLASDGTKMSKSKGNGVNPDEIVSEYGADALRMYILFMGPFEEPVPWNLNGLIGVRRFLDKVVRYVSEWNESRSLPLTKGESEGVLPGVVERHLKKISDDIEAFKFNTAVSAFMTLFNDVGDQSLTRDQLKRILTVLCPFAPHVANECFEMIGEKGLVEEQAWPEFDAELLKRDIVEIAVQVNGKARSTITIAPDADEATARAAAMADENVAKHLAGKEIVKVVYVPGKIVNVVVK
ncbi:MAG: leucine--tRNA ligase [Patescibacteria group bacterium]